MAMSEVPGEERLYISGMYTLRRQELMKAAAITHVLSVMAWPLNCKLATPYEHMKVDVDDMDDENLLEHFPQTNAFIQAGLDGGGGVLVHCAMGKSRSATCVIAYLMHKHHINPSEALSRIRQKRSICEPNDGFMKQLELYHKMDAPDEFTNHPLYQRWLFQKEVKLGIACGKAPERVHFPDEQADSAMMPAGEDAGAELRCRKCRQMLATSQYIIPHIPKEKKGDQKGTAQVVPPPCAHYFLDPLSWMRPELEEGKLSGRLECPKCKTNVGKYAWQGMKCSCGGWVVPGISVARGRIDETKSKGLAGDNPDVDIRRPPEEVEVSEPSQVSL